MARRMGVIFLGISLALRTLIARHLDESAQRDRAHHKLRPVMRPGEQLLPKPHGKFLNFNAEGPGRDEMPPLMHNDKNAQNTQKNQKTHHRDSLSFCGCGIFMIPAFKANNKQMSNQGLFYLWNDYCVTRHCIIGFIALGPAVIIIGDGSNIICAHGQGAGDRYGGRRRTGRAAG